MQGLCKSPVAIVPFRQHLKMCSMLFCVRGSPSYAWPWFNGAFAMHCSVRVIYSRRLRRSMSEFEVLHRMVQTHVTWCAVFGC